MGTGIMICGMNGSGKSTLGKALAERINFRFIDNENLYFQRFASNEPYGAGRTKEEVIRVDGTKAVEENIDFILEQIKRLEGEE